MRNLFWPIATCLLAACSDPSDEPTKPGPRDVDVDPSTADTRRDAGPDKDDDARVSTGSASTPGPSFAECASTRVGAQLVPAASNIIWVVDASASMNEEAKIVQQNLNGFVQSIENGGLTDYRVAVITMPEFLKVPEPLNSDIDHFRFVIEDVQSNDSFLAPIKRIDDLAGFLLPDVVTHFVVVTDDDSTQVKAADFVTRMRGKLGEVRVHAIASPPGITGVIPGWGLPVNACGGPNGSATAQGIEVFEAAKLSGGTTYSICTDDWSALFSALATTVRQSAIPCTIALPAPSGDQDIDTTRVNVVLTQSGEQGAAIPSVGNADKCGSKAGWHYDDTDNPARIVLCPASCESAQQGGTLDIALGCATIAI